MLQNRNNFISEGIQINGIGGIQMAGPPVKCEVKFNSGWNYNHSLKPMTIAQAPNTVILGQDFMSMFDKTSFDWSNGRIKIGNDWIFFMDQQDNVDLPCEYNLNSSIEFLNELKQLNSNYIDILHPLPCFSL